MALLGRILAIALRILFCVVLVVIVVVAVMATLSYFALRGEFDNAQLVAAAPSCENYPYPSPPIKGLPQYSANPDEQLKIDGVRYWTMRTFNSELAMIANTYENFDPGKDEHVALASFHYSPMFMSEQDGDVRWVYRRDREDLVADVYYDQSTPGYLDVFVAFEGTDWSQLGDILSNAAWLTGFFARNEYDVAREVFADVVATAKRDAEPGEKVRYVALGHSLGGGIAQHIAFGFPCVTAVVLDASFVVNRHSYKEKIPDPQVIQLGDRGEIFTFLRERQGLDDPLSKIVTFVGGPFDGFMPGGRTSFYTINATDVATGPTDFWQLFLEQHSVTTFAGTANDMLMERYWKGDPDYQPFRLRCLSRLSRPNSCTNAEACKKHGDALQQSTGYTFAQMCSQNIVPQGAGL